MTLPATGGSQNSLVALILAAGALLIVGGLGLRGRLATVKAPADK
jgi:LPXTG-motif cell wall-anchored protein